MSDHADWLQMIGDAAREDGILVTLTPECAERILDIASELRRHEDEIEDALSIIRQRDRAIEAGLARINRLTKERDELRELLRWARPESANFLYQGRYHGGLLCDEDCEQLLRVDAALERD